MSNLVKVFLHGEIGKKFGSVWELNIKSVSEAINAINSLTNGELNKFLLEKEQQNIRYNVCINGENFISEHGSLDKLEDAQNIIKTNLVIPVNNLSTIDIIPLLEGADSGILNSILGALLIVVGIIVIVASGGSLTALGVGLIMIGAGLLAAGIMALLAKPPTFDDFREIGGAKKVSYLFNGPENVTREGGPIPVGYGRLLVGSQVIGASYVINDIGGEKLYDISSLPGFYIRSYWYSLHPGDPGYPRITINIPATYPINPGIVFEQDSFNQGYYELEADGKTLKIQRIDPDFTFGFPSTFGPDPVLAARRLDIGPNPIANPFPKYPNYLSLPPQNP